MDYETAWRCRRYLTPSLNKHLNWIEVLCCFCKVEAIQPFGSTCNSYQPCHLFFSEAASQDCFYPVAVRMHALQAHWTQEWCWQRFPVSLSRDRFPHRPCGILTHHTLKVLSSSAPHLTEQPSCKWRIVLHQCPSLLCQNDQSMAWLLFQHIAEVLWKSATILNYLGCN